MGHQINLLRVKQFVETGHKMLVLTSIYFVAAPKKRGENMGITLCAHVPQNISPIRFQTSHFIILTSAICKDVLSMLQILVMCRERSKRV